MGNGYYFVQNKVWMKFPFQRFALLCTSLPLRLDTILKAQAIEALEFITEDSRPMLACFFCYARLKQCHKFQQKCVEAEAVFTQMLDEEYEHKPIQAELEFFGGFLKTPIQYISTEDRQQEDETEDKEGIKEELSGSCEIIDDVEIKPEYHSGQLEQETKDDNYTGLEDNPHTQSESEDDTPLASMKTAVDQVKNKKRATKKKIAPRKKSVLVRKKPKLDIRKENLEDTIPTQDQKNEEPISKVIDITKSSKFKSVSKIVEPIKINPIMKSLINKYIIDLNSENAAICTNLSNNINNDDLKCNNRGINSDDIQKRVLHRRNLSKEKRYKCDVCQKRFYYISRLKRHFLVHTGEKPYKCDLCQSRFYEMYDLKVHNRKHTGEKPYKCDICQMMFMTNFNLKQHILRHNGEKPYKCNICPSSFPLKAQLTRHNNVHSGIKPYKCDICQWSFVVNSSLNNHFRTHTGEKPFKCDICQSRFSQQSNLKKHIRTHTGERSYKCDICQSMFMTKHGLKQHILRHNGEKPYKCNICPSSFPVKAHLNRHISVHTGIKPYKCDICQRSFVIKSALNTHVRIHADEKPFKCDICQYRFNHQSNLINHIRRHTGEKTKTYKCDICQSWFNQQNFIKHIHQH